MDDETTVCIATFENRIQADLARQALDAEHIACYLVQDDCGGWRPEFQLFTGVRLFVLESDAERAAAVVAETPDVDGPLHEEPGT